MLAARTSRSTDRVLANIVLESKLGTHLPEVRSVSDQGTKANGCAGGCSVCVASLVDQRGEALDHGGPSTSTER